MPKISSSSSSGKIGVANSKWSVLYSEKERLITEASRIKESCDARIDELLAVIRQQCERINYLEGKHQ